MRSDDNIDREKAEMMKKEEERRKSMVPMFETIEERAQRLVRERELEEFGHALEFRLSAPSPRY